MFHYNSTWVFLFRLYDLPRLCKWTIDNNSSLSVIQSPFEAKAEDLTSWLHTTLSLSLSVFTKLISRTQVCVRYKNVLKY